jgi:predicted alpha/beta-hydrolase family hydrolase
VSTYGLSPEIQVEWIAGGDHSFKPQERENLETAIAASVRFITSV